MKWKYSITLIVATGEDKAYKYTCGNTKSTEALDCDTEEPKTCYYKIPAEETESSSPRQISFGYVAQAIAGILLILRQTL